MGEWLVVGIIALGFAAVVYFLIQRQRSRKDEESWEDQHPQGWESSTDPIEEIEVEEEDQRVSKKLHHPMDHSIHPWHTWPVEDCACNNGARIDMKVGVPKPILTDDVMNVGQLKHLLQPFEDDKPVFLATDEEGNTYYRLYEAKMEPSIVLDATEWPLILSPAGTEPVEVEEADRG